MNTPVSYKGTKNFITRVPSSKVPLLLELIKSRCPFTKESHPIKSIIKIDTTYYLSSVALEPGPETYHPIWGSLPNVNDPKFIRRFKWLNS
jgi:hypothetical protein